MGGSAYLIRGDLDPDRLRPRIAPVDRCSCQWCAPNFDHAATDSLLPTRTA